MASDDGHLARRILAALPPARGTVRLRLNTGQPSELIRLGTALAAVVEQHFQGMPDADLARRWADLVGAERDRRGWIVKPHI